MTHTSEPNRLRKSVELNDEEIDWLIKAVNNRLHKLGMFGALRATSLKQEEQNRRDDRAFGKGIINRLRDARDGR